MTQGISQQNPSPFQRPHSARMGLGKLSACALACALMLGCGKTMEDLHLYVEDVKARESTGIPPIPEVKPYEPFAYQGNNRQDPFDSTVIAKGLPDDGKGGEGTQSPIDDRRPPEFLESFPLDTLRMVGTLAQGPVLWALVRTPDSTIQRVKKGNYMGQNYGKIDRISDSGIDLTEIIPDGIGDHWIERKTYVALSDKKS